MTLTAMLTKWAWLFVLTLCCCPDPTKAMSLHPAHHWNALSHPIQQRHWLDWWGAGLDSADRADDAIITPMASKGLDHHHNPAPGQQPSNWYSALGSTTSGARPPASGPALKANNHQPELSPEDEKFLLEALKEGLELELSLKQNLMGRLA